MCHVILFRTILLLLFVVSCQRSFAQKTPKVVFVIADGIAADMIERHPAPALTKIAAAGSYLKAFVGGEKDGYSESPTISAVGYNSLLTGTWANKHNVWDNDIDSPNYSYPTIFRLLKNASPEKTIGIFSSWTDNRTKLAGEALPQTGRLTFQFTADGFELDTIRFPHDKERSFMHRIDEQVVTNATTAFRNGAPDLSWVYLEYTDDMGHLWGDSPQMDRAIDLLDMQISKLQTVIAYREQQFNEDWLLLITTDHGRDSATGKNHGGQSIRERSTWIISNKKLDNAYAKSFVPGVVDLYPTIARHLGVSIPDSIAFELDGVALKGPLSVAQPAAMLRNDSVLVSWKVVEPEGNVAILVSMEDRKRSGGADRYRMVGEVPAGKESFSMSIALPVGNYIKVVIKGKNNSINRWVGSDAVLKPRHRK